LDTLKELADAINDDASFAATVTTALGGKQPLDADLTALAAITTGDGFAKRTGSAWKTTPSMSKLELAQPVCIVQEGVGIPLGNTAATVGTSEHILTCCVTANGLSVEFVHWQTSDADASGTITFNASIKVASTIYRLTFGGRTLATLDPSGRIVSDEMNLSVAVGDDIAVRTFLASGTAYSPRAVLPEGLRGGFTATTDLTPPGSAAIAAGSGYYFGPATVLGHPDPAAAASRSVLLAGDSISKAKGDGYLGDSLPQLISAPYYGMGGFVLRALVGKAGLVSIARNSDSASSLVSNASLRRMSMTNRTTSAIIAEGINDLVGGRTPAQLQGDVLNLAKMFRRTGHQKVYITTITPDTTSTDGWATTTNQTAFANNANRVTHNNWVRAGAPIDPSTLLAVTVGTGGALLAGSPGHPITGYFEVADTVESARDSGKWKIPVRSVSTGSITSGAFTLNATGAAFTSADIGRAVTVMGAGSAGGILTSYIKTVASATQVGISDAAGTTVSGSAITLIGLMNVDGLHPAPDGHLAMSTAIDYTKL
jgi:lysophospholipase L1-like esterase